MEAIANPAGPHKGKIWVTKKVLKVNMSPILKLMVYQRMIKKKKSQV